jgi:acyl-CoA-dependent ceramide synthase
MAPYLDLDIQNPFASVIFISYRLPTSSSSDSRYGKGYMDLVFIAYYIVFFSFVRQFVTTKICRPIARYFGIKKGSKIDRFGEQGYALLYFAFFGAWGYVRVLIFLDSIPC